MRNTDSERDQLLVEAFRRTERESPPAGGEGPALAGLERSRRPQPGTVCEQCPNSVWFVSPMEVRCYCRVMYVVTWSSKEPQQLTACDGVLLR